MKNDGQKLLRKSIGHTTEAIRASEKALRQLDEAQKELSRAIKCIVFPEYRGMWRIFPDGIPALDLARGLGKLGDRTLTNLTVQVMELECDINFIRHRMCEYLPDGE